MFRKKKQVKQSWIRPGDIVCDEHNKPVWMCLAIEIVLDAQVVTWWRLREGSMFDYSYSLCFAGWRNTMSSGGAGFTIWRA